MHADPDRLRAELDGLKAAGAQVLRITALSEGVEGAPLQAVPTLQPRPGVFDPRFEEALDLVLFEMRKRSMRALLVLNNMWSWSGGFAAYIVWARGGTWRDIPYPSSHLSGYWDEFEKHWADTNNFGQRPINAAADWDTYQKWASQFYTTPRAIGLAEDAIRRLVSRINSMSGLAYAEDGTIFGWELCNEPRAVSDDHFRSKQAYTRWVQRTSSLLKTLAPKQLVAIGHEGTTPFEDYVNADFVGVHQLPTIDVITAHVWPQNWGWGDATGRSPFNNAIEQALSYVEEHAKKARAIGKPLIIEEFGLARDGNNHNPSTSKTLHREAFYSAMVRAADRLHVSGVMPWAWSGKGRPRNPGGYWMKGDDFLGDPPHEPQGWYSIFDTDVSTIQLLSQGRGRMHATPPTPPWPPLPPKPPPPPPLKECHSEMNGDTKVEACEGWCSDPIGHCAFCKCRGCAALKCAPSQAAQPAAAAGSSCHSGLPDDSDHARCEPWCDAMMQPSHCPFCKCKLCPTSVAACVT